MKLDYKRKTREKKCSLEDAINYIFLVCKISILFELKLDEYFKFEILPSKNSNFVFLFVKRSFINTSIFLLCIFCVNIFERK